MLNEFAVRQLLYVDDHDGVRGHVSYLLRESHQPLRTASSVAEARSHAAPGTSWCGIIADHHLPDGRGLTLIEELRTLHGSIPAALTTGELSRTLANDCSRLGVQYIVKPFEREELTAFLARITAVPPGQVGLEQFANQIGASPREREIMQLVLIGRRTNARVAAEVGVSPNTVKTHIRRILAKSDAPSMARLRSRLQKDGYVACEL